MILNNQPISPDYDDDTNEVLTPNHPVFGRQLNSENMYTDNKSTTEEPLKRRQKHLNRRQKHFWKVWQTENLSALRKTHKSSPAKKSIPVAVDDVVIIHADQVLRQRWSLGRMAELLPGHDGQIRSAKVLTSNGNLITRPLYKLYPLESVQATYQEDHDTSLSQNIHVEEATEEAEEEIQNNSDAPKPIIGEAPQREASVRAELKMKYGQK